MIFLDSIMELHDDKWAGQKPIVTVTPSSEIWLITMGYVGLIQWVMGLG